MLRKAGQRLHGLGLVVVQAAGFGLGALRGFRRLVLGRHQDGTNVEERGAMRFLVLRIIVIASECGGAESERKLIGPYRVALR